MNRYVTTPIALAFALLMCAPQVFSEEGIDPRLLQLMQEYTLLTPGPVACSLENGKPTFKQTRVFEPCVIGGKGEKRLQIFIDDKGDPTRALEFTVEVKDVKQVWVRGKEI